MYADDTKITCKSLVNDLNIVITIKLKWDRHINQRQSKAQQKLFFLEEKRSLFYKYESKKVYTKVKSYQFYFTRKMYRSRFSQTADNYKICKDEHSSRL